MVPVTPIFPLFKLPYLAWKNVLETMIFFDLTKASLCSRRLKRFIRSMFRKPTELNLHFITDQFGLGVNSLLMSHFELNSFNFTFQGPSSLRASFLTYFPCDLVRQGEGIPSNLDAKSWIRHLMETFNSDGVGLTILSESYEIDNVQRIIEGLKITSLGLGGRLTDPYFVKALETFQPTRKLSLYRKPEMDEPTFDAFITRNYEYIYLRYPMTLEEVLALTSKTIGFYSLPAADFNLLLKQWIDGWNPELFEFYIDVIISDQNYVPVIFEGLNYRETLVKSDESTTKPAYEIEATDGKTATISFRPIDGGSIGVKIKI